MTATRKAKALVKRLGAGWKPCVWENLGWHYEAVKGEPVLIQVHPHRDGTYTIFLQTYPQVVTEHRDPKLGVRAALRQAAAIADGLRLAIHQVRAP